MPVLDNEGFCTTCPGPSRFVADDAWLRDYYRCVKCGSIPRERALMHVIEQFYPAWKTLAIHESSPAGRGASVRLARECPAYASSQFFLGAASGTLVKGQRCENLEAMSFADASIDLHVSQDVLEHVFDPAQVFREIARTLKPGGGHVCTVPLVRRGGLKSERRARLRPDGSIEHLAPAEYHGNPVSDEGSLVIMDWGFDICQAIHQASGLFTTMIQIDDLSRGIRAEYIEVLVTQKPL